MSKPAVKRDASQARTEERRVLIGYGDDDPELTDEQNKMLQDAAVKGAASIAGAAVGSTVGPSLKEAKFALSAANAAEQLGAGLVSCVARQVLAQPVQ